MNAQEIPILTEVYAAEKTKGVDAQQEGITAMEVMSIIEDYKSEMESELKQSLLETLKPQLTAEIAAEIAERLKQSLGEEVAAQLKTELVSGFRKEIAEELKATNHTVSALQNAFTNLPDIDQDVLLQSIDEKNQAFLEAAKQQLSETQASLIQESTERMNLEIAGKIAGMQELAVTQAKAQVAQQIKGLEQGFIENIGALATELQHSATNALKQQMDADSEAMAQAVIERYQQTLSQELARFYEAQIEQSKQAHEAHLTELASAYQTQVAQSQEQFNQQAQTVSQELLQVVTLYAQKLNQESEAKLSNTQATFEAKLATQTEQLQATSTSHLMDLQKTLEANIADVSQQLATELQQMREQNHAKAEEMHQALLAQVNDYTNAVKSDAEKLAIEAQASIKLAQSDLLANASEHIQTAINEELDGLITQKRAAFKQAMDADAPEVAKLLDEKVKALVTEALPAFEEALLQKVKASLVASLATARLVLPND